MHSRRASPDSSSTPRPGRSTPNPATGPTPTCFPSANSAPRPATVRPAARASLQPSSRPCSLCGRWPARRWFHGRQPHPARRRNLQAAYQPRPDPHRPDRNPRQPGVARRRHHRLAGPICQQTRQTAPSPSPCSTPARARSCSTAASRPTTWKPPPTASKTSRTGKTLNKVSSIESLTLEPHACVLWLFLKK